MPLVPASVLLEEARKNGYAVPAFNVENMEMMQAVVQAGRNVSSPVLLQTTPSTLKYASPALYRGMAEALAQDADVPVALHLDHGNSYQLCEAALEAGYTSLMIDGSTLPYPENVDISRRVADMAWKRGIPVEAELGSVGGKEDDHDVQDKDALYTNPDQAAEFVRMTGIQSLAVAIGTAHGHYQGVPRLDFDRLARIREKVDVPLVLHGTSGVAEEDVARCVGLGVCKVNYATDLRDAFTAGVREALADTKIFDPKIFGGAGRRKVSELCERRMRLCGSAGRA